MRGDWVNMQSLTDRRKDKQIRMHDRETERGRQMERGKDRSKFTDITGVVCVSGHASIVDVSVRERTAGGWVGGGGGRCRDVS